MKINLAAVFSLLYFFSAKSLCFFSGLGVETNERENNVFFEFFLFRLKQPSECIYCLGQFPYCNSELCLFSFV